MLQTLSKFINSSTMNKIKKFNRRLHPTRLSQELMLKIDRKRFEMSLLKYQNDASEEFTELLGEGHTLIDGVWDNPNYWLHQATITRALGLDLKKRIGVVGESRSAYCYKTFKRLGVDNVFNTSDWKEYDIENTKLAKHLLKRSIKSSDILKWELPHGIPAENLYDKVLRDQRSERVRLDHPSIIKYVMRYLNAISYAEKIINAQPYKLLITNHGCGRSIPLIWLALKKNIPVLVLWDHFGSSRHRFLRTINDLKDVGERPLFSHYQKMTSKQKASFSNVGEEYLSKRFKGKTSDFGAIYAYQHSSDGIKKKDILRRFDWDADKKIVAIYGSNWFDYPHMWGMKYFTDFYDWTIVTLEEAKKNTNVQWLLKPHPVEEWFGGVGLEKIIGELNSSHIKFSSKEWSGEGLLNSVDAIVTYHGTVGVEATALKKPVLISDQGQYHDWGFSKYPKSREEYLSCLRRSWWEELDMQKSQELAKVYAGIYWGKPLWQKSFEYEDDTLQWKLYKTIPEALLNNSKILDTEARILRKWIMAGDIHYHSFKMMHCDGALNI
jgi:hypothetical protein